jgi:hypothetical protein
MSTIRYLPSANNSRVQAPIDESEGQEVGTCRYQIELVAHDLKNSMSVLLLVIGSLKDNQPLITESRKRLLEHVLEEMNRLVDDMVRLGGRQVDK